MFTLADTETDKNGIVHATRDTNTGILSNFIRISFGKCEFILTILKDRSDKKPTKQVITGLLEMQTHFLRNS